MPEDLPECVLCGEPCANTKDDGICQACIDKTCGYCGGEIFNKLIGDESYHICADCKRPAP